MEKPIIFSTPMVKAIIEGRKTQTRRVIKPQPEMEGGIIQNGILYRYLPGNELDMNNPIKAKYQFGDILWVRETWQHAYNTDDNDQIIESTGRYLYAANPEDHCAFSHWVDRDTGVHKESMPWKPSIFMPRKAARIFLEVLSIRAEQLWSITESDAKKEGVSPISPLDLKQMPMSIIEPGGKYGKGTVLKSSYKAAFYELWDSLNAKRGYDWNSNPWVWVYEFKRVEEIEK